jgi:small conductance mechanosensitive channel
LLLMFGAWMVARWARRSVEKSLGRTRLDLTLTKFFANISAWMILVLAVLTALSIFGVNTTSFAAVIGAAGLAIGLAFQGTLSNFAAGVMLLTFRPFKVGDTVNVAGVLGKIDEIDLFMTKMDTFDNRRFVIPNSKIFGTNIETVTYHPTRRADVSVGIDYAADIDATRAVLMAAAGSVAEHVEGGLTDPEPAVVLDSFGDSSVNWSVRVWCKTPDFLFVKQAVIRAVKMHLDEAGIAIPFPQVDVHFDPPAADTPERMN